MTIEALSGSLLADGTDLRELVDVERRALSGRVFSDQEIFDLERERIFGRTWVFLGLESEISEPGDFVTRTLGTDAVIVARDHSGAVNVLLNVCAHRAAQVCMVDGGKADTFRCPYHGWVYDPAGRLVAIPAEREFLGDTGDKSEFRLQRARVATYGGLIFATWDETLPSFEDYIGDFKWYLDVAFGSLDKPLVVAGPPQRFVTKANWKLASDNFAGDGYHAMTLHASMGDIGVAPGGFLDKIAGFAFSAAMPETGHSITCVDLTAFVPMFGALELAVPWIPPDARPQLERNLLPEQMRLLNNGVFPGIGMLFPNFVWLGLVRFPGTPAAGFTVRTFMPVAPDRTEVWSWALVHPDLSDEEKRQSAQMHTLTFGASGIFEQDDLAAWARIQTSVSGGQGRRQYLRYPSSRPPSPSGVLPDGDWPGPGDIWGGFSTDDSIWYWHMKWLELMTAGG